MRAILTATALSAALLASGCMTGGPLNTGAGAADAAAAAAAAATIDAAASAADAERAALLARQPAGAYSVEPTHTSVHWRINHLGLSNYTARFNTIAGTLDFNPANPTASRVDITIDPRSIDTGLPNFNAELAQRVFQADTHPQIRFVSTGLAATSATTGTMTGDLSFAGVTRPVTLEVRFNGGQPNRFAGGRQSVGFSATTTISRAEWGSTWLAPAIGDTVEIAIEAEFLRNTL